MPSPTAPTSIDALPTPPTTSDPSTFDSRADATLLAQQAMVPQVNTSNATTYANALIAFDSAAAALASQAAAAASAGVSIWVSGTTYAIGDNRFSPINFQTYRRKTAGAGSTDPSLDGTNWALITQSGQSFSGVATSAVTASMTAAHLGQLYKVTATGATITFPAVAGCAAGSALTVAAEFSTGTVILKGNGSELLASSYGTTANTFTIAAGETIQYVSNGTSWDQLSYSIVTCVTQATSDNSTKLISSLWAKVGLASSFGTTGYVTFPTWLGGFTIQWGSGTASNAGVTNTFPIAFPSLVYVVIPAPWTVTPTAISVNSVVAASFIAYVTSGTPNMFYFAIGK